MMVFSVKPVTCRYMVRCISIAFFAATTLLLAQQSELNTAGKLGYPRDTRLLIIHADDLGMSHSVNQATFEALEKGWITSASILVPCPWFPEVARWAKQHPNADLGIHLALTSEWTDFRWGPMSGPQRVPSLVDANGYFPLDTDVVAARARPDEMESELTAQVDRARAMGIPLSHLDMHMAVMVESAAIFDVYRKMQNKYKLLALLEAHGAHAPPAGISALPDEASVDRVITMEPGVAEKDWLHWYKKQLAPLPPGVYQLIVHLASDDEEMRGATWDHPDWGAAWRQRDLNMVKSAEFQKFLKEQGFVLITWKELAEARGVAAR
jgi:chitin disaccharide deacetylase